MPYVLPVDADDGGVTLMELLAVLGAGMWLGGVVWLVVHLLSRGHHRAPR